MRLREIQLILAKVDFKEGMLTKNDNGYFTNINGFKRFVAGVRNIPIYSDEIEFIENTVLYGTTSDFLTGR